MDAQTKANLNSVLDGFVAQKQHERQAAEATRARALQLRLEFEKLQDELMALALKEVGDMVRCRGYEFEIEATRASPDLKASDPLVSMWFSVMARTQRQYRPSFEIRCDSRRGVVRFLARIPARGNFVADLGSADMAEVTSQLVQEKAVELVKLVFDGKPL